MCLGINGCTNDPFSSEFGVGPEDTELGKSLFEPTDLEESKSDSVSGKKGLPISVDSSSTQVWDIRNQWLESDTEEARKSGMAWPEESGLDWNQKYSLWIRKMIQIDAHTYGQTFELITPFGKTLPAPSIECAETSLFLRATFASWYHLPFFVEAKDRNRKRVFP